VPNPDGTWPSIAVEPKSTTNPEINSCHSIQPLREITSATSFQLRQESYIIVSIEFALRESALEEQREKTRGEKRERRNGSSPTHAYLYAFSNHHRNGLHQMQRADETRIDRAAGRTVQPRHVSLQRMRGGREFPEGDLILKRFPAKHALGLDPGVETGSRKENASKQKLETDSDSIRIGSDRVF
jgi:hypothetical protein